jgi:hypothetical protein
MISLQEVESIYKILSDKFGAPSQTGTEDS